MLQAIHDRITGWVAWFIIGIISLVFIFWGIDVGFGTVSYAAKVNGEEIEPTLIRRAFQEQIAQYQQYTRGEVPAELRQQLGNNILDDAIRVELLSQKAKEQGYRVSDEEVLRTYRQIPSFQVDGRYDTEQAKRVLANEGMTPAQYEAEQRRVLQMAQVQGGIAASSFVTPVELERLRALETEEREASWAIVPAASMLEAATPDEAAIKEYYERNKERFKTPDTVDLRYVELKLEDVARNVTVTEEALRSHYENMRDRFEEPERRRVRQMLFNVASDADDAAARKKADDALARVKGGEDFAKLARTLSEDPGSAGEGGDLGWIQPGFFDGPLDSAIFSMSKGEVRGPVRSQYGYHVLQVEDIETGKQKSYEEARADVEAEYRQQEAEKLFSDRQEELAAKAFENIDSLEPVAEDLGLEVRTAQGFTRDGAQSPWGARPEIVEAAFDDAVLNGQNSDAIELAPGHVVVLRSENRKPPAQKPLEAVREQIAAQLRTERSRELARKAGESAIARLRGGAEWPAAVSEIKATAAGPKFIGRTDDSVPSELRQALFATPKPADNGRQYGTAALANGDFAIFAFTGTRHPTEAESAADRAARAQQAARRAAQTEVGGYIAELRREADIDRNPKIFE